MSITGLRTDGATIADVSQVPTFNSLRSALYRFRSHERPALPRQRSDIDLPDIYTKTTAGDNFLLASEGEHDKILVFTTDENIRHLSRAKVLYCDGTFDKCPAIFGQLYTIHAFIENKMFPLVYALLPNKSQRTYERFLDIVKHRSETIQCRISPDYIFTDFERAAQNALNLTFPGSQLKGCFFHYSQAIWKYAQKCHLSTRYKREPQVTRLIRRAIALPFVPVGQIEDVWLNILEDSPEDADITTFTDYVTTYWVEGDHGRMLWNHYETNGPRTTNHVEGWHRKLSMQIPCSNPNIFSAIDFIKIEQAYVEVTVQQLLSGGSLQPRKRKYRNLDNALLSYKRDLETGEKTIMEFLDCVSHLTGF